MENIHMKKKDKGKWVGIGIGMAAIIKEIGTMVFKNRRK